jgi:hypothetical protein
VGQDLIFGGGYDENFKKSNKFFFCKMEVPGSANAVRNEPSFKDFLKKANSGVIEEDGSNKFRRGFRDILDLEN